MTATDHPGLSVGYYTHVGGRKLNEDDLFHVTVQVGGRPVHLAGVADGMGGNDAGEAASQAAVQACQTLLVNALMALVAKGRSLTPEFLEKCAAKAMENANRAVLALDKPGSPGCTLTFGIFTDSHAAICHAGDSRAYLCDAAGAAPLTRDHADGNGALTNRLGRWEDMDCDVEVHELRRDAVYLFCSDGVHGNVDDAGIASCLGSSPDAKQGCVTLVETARRNGGSQVDNCTALAVEVGSLPRSRKRPAGNASGRRVKRVARSAAEAAPQSGAMPEMPAPQAAQRRARKDVRERRFLFVTGGIIALLLLLIGLLAWKALGPETPAPQAQASAAQQPVTDAPGAQAPGAVEQSDLPPEGASPQPPAEAQPTAGADAGGIFGLDPILAGVALVALLASGCVVYLLLPSRD